MSTQSTNALQREVEAAMRAYVVALRQYEQISDKPPKPGWLDNREQVFNEWEFKRDELERTCSHYEKIIDIAGHRLYQDLPNGRELMKTIQTQVKAWMRENGYDEYLDKWFLQ